MAKYPAASNKAFSCVYQLRVFWLTVIYSLGWNSMAGFGPGTYINGPLSLITALDHQELSNAANQRHKPEVSLPYIRLINVTGS